MSGMRPLPVLAVVAASLIVVAACSSEGSPSGTTSSSSGGESGGPDSGLVVPAEDAGAGEDAGEADSGGPIPTKKTSLEATINGVVRTLDRAQFGVTKADGTLYLEAHEGGVAECPETKTPKRTLIVRDVPKGAPGARFTKSDGVGSVLFDFAGDQIDSLKPTTASAVTVTIVDITDATSVEIEIDATFPEGTVKGRLYATYCAAMDE